MKVWLAVSVTAIVVGWLATQVDDKDDLDWPFIVGATLVIVGGFSLVALGLIGMWQWAVK